MKLKSICKKFASIGLAAALVVSGITYQPNSAKAAAELPEVTVLGATLSLDAEAGKQSMRVAIQVTNANNASACGMDITYNGKKLTFSTENEGQKKLYDYDEKKNTVVYAVKITNIPKANFEDDFEIKGFATAIGEDEPSAESVVETKSVNDVVDAIIAKDNNISMVNAKLVTKVASLDVTKVADLPTDAGNNFMLYSDAEKGYTTAVYDDEKECAVVTSFDSNDEEVALAEPWGIRYKNTVNEEMSYIAEVKVEDPTGLDFIANWGGAMEPKSTVVDQDGWTSLTYEFTTGWYWHYGIRSTTVSSYNLKEFNLYKALKDGDIADTKLDKSIEVDLSSATALYDKGKLNYNKEDNSFEVVMVDEAKFDGAVIPLGISLANGESITVVVNGSQTGTSNLRMYLSNDGNGSVSNQANGASFGQEYTFTATGAATQLLIKGGYGGEISALSIDKVVIKK